MTAIHARQPLEVLSMSSTQRQTRRKTTRHLFDDDDEPPAKRTKVDSVPVAVKPAVGKSSSGRTKKPRAAYDEDADGFQFTRKTRSKKASNEPVPVDEPQAVITKPRAAVKAKTQLDKTDSLLGSTSSETEAGQRRRRSARLSGDKEEVVQILPAEKPKRKRKSNELATSESNRDGSPAAVLVALQVEKKREGTKIALPFADTPVINRNKEMRAGKNKAPHRRSSVGSRGRRASSLIESGTSNALPHTDVPTSDFHKHISHSLIEPKRMRQLLTWSATRALPAKPTGGNGNSSEIFTIEASRQIIEDLLKDFANKPDMSDWFSREDEVGKEEGVKRPNPRNEGNKARLGVLEEECRRLKEEEGMWGTLTSPPKPEKDEEGIENIDTTSLAPSQAAILATLQLQSPTTSAAAETKDLETRLQKINAGLEQTIDTFADGIHRMSQYNLAAGRVADKVLGSTARKLEIREREAREVTGTMGMGGRDVLAALAGALNGSGRSVG